MIAAKGKATRKQCSFPLGIAYAEIGLTKWNEIFQYCAFFLF